MKIRIGYISLLLLLAGNGFCQYNWKLKKDERGIKVYAADVPNSGFKAIRVECMLAGNYNKLVQILSDVPQMQHWIYHCKTSRLLQKTSPTNYTYFTETVLPWPMSNREAVINMQINTDSLPAFLTISGTAVPGYVARSSGLVRISDYHSSWRVSMPGPQTLSIQYEITLDPGGSLPAWIANMFVTKGPYETFVNLGQKLKE